MLLSSVYHMTGLHLSHCLPFPPLFLAPLVPLSPLLTKPPLLYQPICQLVTPLLRISPSLAGFGDALFTSNRAACKPEIVSHSSPSFDFCQLPLTQPLFLPSLLVSHAQFFLLTQAGHRHLRGCFPHLLISFQCCTQSRVPHSAPMLPFTLL